MSRKRRTFSAKQKAKIALAALQERLPKGEIATQYEVHPNQVSLWKKQAVDGLARCCAANEVATNAALPLVGWPLRVDYSNAFRIKSGPLLMCIIRTTKTSFTGSSMWKMTLYFPAGALR